MASEEPVRMFETEPNAFELTEIDAPEEELLGSYLPIGDVAKLIGVNPSVLRFWEQEFPQLRPTKRGNRRYYSADDVSLIRTIQHLLYEEHYTILGARNKIHELQVQDKARDLFNESRADERVMTRPAQGISQPSPQPTLATTPAPDMTPILKELRAIRRLLTKEDKAHEVENFTLQTQEFSSVVQEEKPESVFSLEVPVQAFAVDSHAKFPEHEQTAVVQEPQHALYEEEASATSTVPTAFVETAAPVTTSAVEQAPVAEPAVQPSAAKVDTSGLAIPPLPGQQRAFTIGMKVQKVGGPNFTHISSMGWGKK